MIWAVPGTLETAPLFADLQQNFRVRTEKDLVRTRQWFDTDDWRLYRRNLLLFLERGKWTLMRCDSGETAAACSVKKCEGFRFAMDFPLSEMREKLTPLLSVRALLPMATQQTTTSCLRILNNDRKTVVLLYLDTCTTRESGAEFRTLTLKGMRGYDAHFEEISSFLALYGIKKQVDLPAPFVEGVLSTGRAPGDYSSKFSVDLQPDMTARQAMVLIYQRLLAAMIHNEEGIIEDLDSEFLHDFRVAVRRTRSGLGQVKRVFPAGVVKEAGRDFSWLGSITGPTRDLDVYLLDREKYMGRLPEQLRPQLIPFFDDMAQRREDEWKRLVDNLRTEKYRSVIRKWKKYLHDPDPGPATPDSRRPLKELAREILFRKYGKVIKRGKAIKRSSPDGDLHRLRIQCKKLRYIMEFFASLFPAGEIKKAVRQLKKLQDNLGTFNDLSVQQDMLREYLAGLRIGSRRSQELSMAIGGLLTDLHHEQQRVRQDFAARFRDFTSKANRQLYAGLFG